MGMKGSAGAILHVHCQCASQPLSEWHHRQETMFGSIMVVSSVFQAACFHTNL